MVSFAQISCQKVLLGTSVYLCSRIILSFDSKECSYDMDGSSISKLFGGRISERINSINYFINKIASIIVILILFYMYMFSISVLNCRHDSISNCNEHYTDRVDNL